MTLSAKWETSVAASFELVFVGLVDGFDGRFEASIEDLIGDITLILLERSSKKPIFGANRLAVADYGSFVGFREVRDGDTDEKSLFVSDA